ncbi:MAG: 16S rRNA (guanine(527)-N(7))-methyltransferase RsmG [Bdellovibrionales bacterium]|nr:16S rRNA (guanine(527)-N(7))-methyltransferase RsmG [Bdellovibrionales bacterium]
MNHSLLSLTCNGWGLALSSKQENTFAAFRDLLLESNERVNLTRIEQQEIESLHFLDSVRIAVEIDLNEIHSLLDVGSGAGFPALPLAIMYPHLKVHVLDASERRLDFIEYAARQLGLSNITYHHGRAEELAHESSLREAFPLVTARALAPLHTLIELILPFVELSGKAALLRANDHQEEESEFVRATGLLGCTLEGAHTYTLPQKEESRSVLLISKSSSTPKDFPRSKKKMERQPLTQIASTRST